MRSANPRLRIELLTSVRHQLSEEESNQLFYLAIEDPVLFIAEILAAHKTGRVTLPKPQVRELKALLDLPEPGPTT